MMKKFFLFFSLGIALMCTSCEEVLDSVTLKEEVSIPPMSFVIDRMQMKAAGEDTLMDESFLLPLDSLLATLNYSGTNFMDYLDNMKVKKIFFQLVDTANVNTFNFIDSARLAFSTRSIPEVTIAHAVVCKTSASKNTLELSLDLTDITTLVKAKDSIRARVYGHVDLDSLPASVENVEVLVGGTLGMELKPQK